MKRNGGKPPPVLPPAPAELLDDERTGSGNPPRVSMVSASLHSGPLPPAEMLAKYEEILPGSAERIFRLAESEALHRRAREVTAQEHYGKAVSAQIKQAGLGLILGFGVALAGLALAGYALYQGDGVAAAIIASVDLVGLTGIFVYGSKQKQSDDRARNATDITRSGSDGAE